ncbi:uracil-DNA glycosylase [Candidatus Gottesmanbacteria bacterium]|nr:uracil-DNA glycosylase [Candidatus Gottesmanbacteria bacterium]
MVKIDTILGILSRQIASCKRCPLYKTANHSVPGEGSSQSSIVFVGEAPGRKEDETGRPFVGRAGKLLEYLLHSINLRRKDVFITSILKHRPPKNRTPKPQEIKACSYWFVKQIAIIQPKLIIPLGRFGLEFFLPHAKITQVHGTIKEIPGNRGLRIFPMFHPAAGLRSLKRKKILFDDFQILKHVLDNEHFSLSH